MAGTISTRDIEYVARLSRLKLKEKEKETFTRQLNKILEHMDKLNKLETAKITPTSHVVPLKNVSRKDIRKPSFPVEEIIKNAADKKKGYFKVPAIIE